MIESLPSLLLLLGAFLAWHNALRARERARALGRELCASAQVQLLDQTVALQRLKFVRVPASGLRVRRDYAFEFSTDGSDRQRGTLSTIGDRLLAHTLAMPAGSSIATGTGLAELPAAAPRRH